MRYLLVALVASVHAFPKPPVVIPAKNPGAPEKLPAGVSKSVLVVGGGLSGLSAALELAERGYSVTIREADTVLGGRLQTNKVELPNVGTFQVEAGFHSWFHNYWQFKDIRARLGIDANFAPWKIAHYIFRKYKPENVYSTGPYPLNMLGVLERSPNLHLSDAIKSSLANQDLMNYDFDRVNAELDNITFDEWAVLRKVDTAFYDILYRPIIQVTVNQRETVSATYMLELMQLYFLSDAKADEREICNKPWAQCVIEPWAAKLRSLGALIELGARVDGLRIEAGRAVGATGDSTRYDHVVMAANLRQVQQILAASAVDAQTKSSFDSIVGQVAQLPNAPPYKVVRVWFGGKLNATRPDIVETPEHFPICLIAQFHLIEDEAAAWANKTGGSVVEFHLYTYNMTSVDASDDAVWAAVLPTIIEIYPEVADLKIVARVVTTRDLFPQWAINTLAIRPFSTFAQTKGVAGLSFAGDWLTTDYPSAFMERAVSTGREAANIILLEDGVRQVNLTVTSKHGPGIL